MDKFKQEISKDIFKDEVEADKVQQELGSVVDALQAENTDSSLAEVAMWWKSEEENHCCENFYTGKEGNRHEG